MSKYQEPTFMVIGAQKSGTSWIYQYFKMHPGIRSLPVKEFHFFDDYERRINGNSIPRGKLRAFLKCIWFGITKHPYYAIWGFIFTFTKRDIDKKTLDRYAKLFYWNKPSGDITPAYATLSEKTIAHIARRFPNLKIIYIMRNPVERLWSATKMNYFVHLKENRDTITEEKYLQQFDKPNLRNDYLHTINSWSKYFPAENIFLGFFEDLKVDAEKFIREIEVFLEIQHYHNPQKLSKTINKGKSMKIRPEHERYLYEKFYPMIKELSIYFKDHPQNPPKKWLEKANNILDKD